MSIETFHDALTATNDGGPLFAALRSLTRIENPAQILSAAEQDRVDGWAVWTEITIPGSGEA